VKALKSAPDSLGDTNSRQVERVPVREGEQYFIQFKDQTKSAAYRLHDISSMGCSFIVSKEISESFKDLNLVFKLKVGKNCELEKSGQIVSRINFGSEKVKLGLRFNYENKVNILEKTNLKFNIHGCLFKEFFFKEKVFFEVIELEKSSFVVELNDTNLILFPKLKIKFNFFLPYDKSPIRQGVVEEVMFVNGKLNAKISFSVSDQKLENSIANYLYDYSNFPPHEISKRGLRTRNYKQALTLKYVQSDADYDEVLKLRKLSYMASGKVKEDFPYQSMKCASDRTSRILMFYHNDTFVASVGLSFPENEEDVLDTQRMIQDLEKKLYPEKSKIFEITRLCIHPQYRGGNIIFRVFEHMFRIFITSGRQYAYSSSDDVMLPIYKSIGFKLSGIKYSHPDFNGRIHHIIYGIPASGLVGKGVNPITWNIIYKEVVDYLISMGVYKPNKIERSRINMYKLIGIILYPVIKRFTLKFK
jgi:hypothetical protein